VFVGVCFAEKWSEDLVSDAVAWRLASLEDVVTRVCDGDATLPSDALQMKLHQMAARYTTGTLVKLGPMLCLFCVLTWTSAVLDSVSCACACMRAICWAAREKTKITNIYQFSRVFSLEAVTRQRLYWCFLLGGLQITISLSLLFAGTAWLVSTTEVYELIPNVLALRCILEFDTLVYRVTVCTRVRGLIENMDPLKVYNHRTRRWPMRSASLTVLVFTFTVGTSFWWLRGIVLTVEDVKLALCPLL